MKGILLAAAITGILFTSCDTKSKEDKAYIDSTLVPANQASQVSAGDAQNNNIQVSQPQQLPAGVQVIQPTAPGSNSVTIPATTQPTTVIAQPQATATAPGTTTAPGMNPPHGQPGHRCDINVGAPLNSKPNPQPAVTQQPVQANMSQQPVTVTAPTTTAPGMNPPHGQPGHRCDISVGAPLNSKPAAAAPTIKSTMTQEPVKKDSGS